MIVCSNRGPVMASSLGAWLLAQVDARLGACSSRLRSPASGVSASLPSKSPTDSTGVALVAETFGTGCLGAAGSLGRRVFSLLKREALTEYEALGAANRPGRAADSAAEAIRVLAEENIVCVYPGVRPAVARWFPGGGQRLKLVKAGVSRFDQARRLPGGANHLARCDPPADSENH